MTDAEKNVQEEKSKPAKSTDKTDERPVEIGGREGPEPTRYGDWENGGIISDF